MSESLHDDYLPLVEKWEDPLPSIKIFIESRGILSVENHRNND